MIPDYCWYNTNIRIRLHLIIHTGRALMCLCQIDINFSHVLVCGFLFSLFKKSVRGETGSHRVVNKLWLLRHTYSTCKAPLHIVVALYRCDDGRASTLIVVYMMFTDLCSTEARHFCVSYMSHHTTHYTSVYYRTKHLQCDCLQMWYISTLRYNKQHNKAMVPLPCNVWKYETWAYSWYTLV